MKRLKLLKLSLRSLNAFGVQGLFFGFRVNLGFRVLGHTAAEHSEEILWSETDSIGSDTGFCDFDGNRLTEANCAVKCWAAENRSRKPTKQ